MKNECLDLQACLRQKVKRHFQGIHFNIMLFQKLNNNQVV